MNRTAREPVQEPHSRPTDSPRRPWLDAAALAAVTGLALALRVWGNGFGLPSVFTPDEWLTMDPALSPGLAVPHFKYGPALGYLVKAVLALYWAAGAVGGRFSTWADLSAAAARDPTAVHLIARSLCGALGALTVLVVAVYGRRWYGHLVGYGGALLLAVNFTHARASHYVATDVPMTLLLTLAAGYAVAAWDRPTRRRLDIVAALVGCAIATKYSAVLALSLPLLLHWRTRAARGWRAFPAGRGLWRSLAIVAGAFLLIFWSAFLRPLTFAHDLGAMLVKSVSGHPGYEKGFVAWLAGPRDSLSAEWGWPALILAPLAVYGAWRRRRACDIVLLALLVPVFVVFGLASVKFVRYAMPALPPLCLFTAAWLSHALRKAGRWRVPLFAAALGAVAAWPLHATIRQNIEFTQPDTRNIAAAWASRHLRAGSRVLMDRSYGPYYPPLDPERFEILWLPSLNARLLLADRPPKRLSLRDYPSADYVILSSYWYARYDLPGTRARHPRISAAYHRLFAEVRGHRRVARFAPAPGRRQGPVVEIYRLRPRSGA